MATPKTVGSEEVERKTLFHTGTGPASNEDPGVVCYQLDLVKDELRPTHKSYKGSFNVRVSPELHRLAAQKARRKGLSLNQLVQEAIEKEVLESAGTRGQAVHHDLFKNPLR